jgi:hypothetical protein
MTGKSRIQSIRKEDKTAKINILLFFAAFFNIKGIKITGHIFTPAAIEKYETDFTNLSLAKYKIPATMKGYISRSIWPALNISCNNIGFSQYNEIRERGRISFLNTDRSSIKIIKSAIRRRNL